MGQDELNFNSATLYIDGQEVGKINNLNIECVEAPKDINFDFNRSFECSFKLKGENRRKLFKCIHLNLENARLIRIFNKTQKWRIKKKLIARINRNIYELMCQ